MVENLIAPLACLGIGICNGQHQFYVRVFGILNGYWEIR